MVVWHFVLWST
ncbi:hypothetical protein LINGRAHAP2_LOCUS11048 [Linum grandiflorum]